MNNPVSEENEIKRLQMVHWIIWGALTSTIFVYLLIGNLLQGTSQAINPTVFWLLAGLSVVHAVMVVALRQILVMQRIGKGQINPATADGMKKLLVVSIVLWALAESIAIYGFVAVLLGAPFAHFGGFIAAALFLLAYCRPQRYSRRRL